MRVLLTHALTPKRRRIARVLRAAGHEVIEVAEAREALERCRAWAPDVALIHAECRGDLVCGIKSDPVAFATAIVMIERPGLDPADAREGLRRAPAPVFEDGALTGEVAWVPDAPGADVLVVVGTDGRVALVQASDAEVETVEGYDATRSLGHVRLDGAAGELLDLTPSAAATAWYVAQGLIAAEAVGAIERALETSVAYAKERFTFGRAIGSYQAVKHELVEILRRLENARSLMYYAGWAAADKPEELPVAASALRLVASEAYDHAARAQISVHGGIGATFEHDAPLYFRKAQLSRRLLGGTHDAYDRVAGELIASAS
jgi:alkylation response protein AidB-like acyl-CoA dehydrogenase